MSVPNDIACCPGWGDGPEDWLDECQDCLRRTAPPALQGVTPVARFALRDRDGGIPPKIVVLWCESYMPPDRPEDQRLRELARRQGLVG
jgi:hypothetical protein